MSELSLTAMRGYPGSGKSTMARQIANELGAVVVSRDELRIMLHDSYWTGKAECEDQVTVAERAMVTALLKNGFSVVLDETNLEPNRLRKWAKLASQFGATFRRYDMAVPVEECIKRDRRRWERGIRSVGEDVIRKMAKRYPMKNWPDIQAPPTFDPTPVEWVEGYPEAIIVDIDGTLAHMDGRSPYDYSQVHTDTVDEQIKWLVNKMDDAGVMILVVSGRDDECREATEKWLSENCIWYDELHMRPTGSVDERGNKLPDYLVKYNLFNEHIRGKYNVRFVLDDRNQVVDLWRAIGLKCLQVAPGDF
ncbi:polynucleotide kinase [Mycobacterium phage OhShagHennessy]|uniref:Polynucleotide kinase n=1 Tax=Mycobacterium phage OhShagHennessy TaxID=2801895 RepID=A0A7U0GCQ0_9CAUD|nr:polynucleotide kinase [Mycobacterium phage OhShagHennessy]QQV92776.1 polynucleotide kinase [Mycobacterium phage OhShagHennessy]